MKEKIGKRKNKDEFREQNLQLWILISFTYLTNALQGTPCHNQGLLKLFFFGIFFEEFKLWNIAECHRKLKFIINFDRSQFTKPESQTMVPRISTFKWKQNGFFTKEMFLRCFSSNLASLGSKNDICCGQWMGIFCHKFFCLSSWNKRCYEAECHISLVHFGAFIFLVYFGCLFSYSFVLERLYFLTLLSQFILKRLQQLINRWSFCLVSLKRKWIQSWVITPA